MTKQEALYQHVIRLADDALILGHRLSELCSRGTLIEEDLALTNISLDMTGRAESLFKYASEIKNDGKTSDDLAFIRAEIGYRNHLLVEQKNDDFAHTIARQLFQSAFAYFFYSNLEKTKDTAISGIASKTIKEIKHHLQHASDWVIRLGDGTEESKRRMQKAIDELWMYTGELFEMDEIENSLLKDGLTADLVPIKSQWQNKIQSILNEATLQMPEDSYHANRR